MALTDTGPDGMSKLDQIGLALSYFGDAANQFRGAQSNYAGANLQALRALQDQLLRTQQINKMQAQQSAQAKLTGSYDPTTGITWDVPSGPTGNFEKLENGPGIAADGGGAPGLANSPKFTLHSLAEDTPEAAAAREGAINAMTDQQRLLMQAYPDQVGQAMASAAFAPPTPVSTPEGGRTDFVRNGRVVSSIVGSPKEPEKVKEVVAMFGPDWKTNPRAVDYFNKITMPMSVSLTANTQGENAFEKSQGEAWGKEAADLGPAANSARDRIASINQFLALSDQVKTGKLTPTYQEIAGWSQAMGIDPKTLGIDPATATAGQVMDKIQNRLAMQNIGPGGLPANNFSEADRKFVQATTVNKANTPEANRLISQIGIAADKRTIEKEQSWLVARARGVNFPTWKQQWAKHVEETPMFPKIDTPEQLAQLPSGTMFTAPDGKIKVKP